ncbi:hypothetical protein QP597_12595 [Providencia stuartii]|nr:hypothetical protein [Providencia stuartii]
MRGKWVAYRWAAVQANRAWGGVRPIQYNAALREAAECRHA